MKTTKGITMKELKEITKPEAESLEQLTNNKGDEDE